MEDQFSITQNSVSDHLTFLPSSSSASSSSASTQRTCHICHARESLTSAELGLLIAKASSSSNPLATKWLHWKCVTPLILRQISNTQSITNCETLPAHIQFRIQRSLLRGTVNESLSTSHQPKPSTPLLYSHTPTTAIFAHHIPSRKPPTPPPRSTGSSSPTPSEMSDFSAPYDPHFLKLSPICPLALQSLPKPTPLPDPYESDDSDRPKKTRVKDRVLWVPVGADDEKVVVKRDTEADVLGDRALRLLRRKQAERNQSDSDGSDEESGSVSPPLPVGQVKRGRGRPRKVVSGVTDSGVSESDSPAPTRPKKRRSKVIHSSTEEEGEDSEKSEDDDDVPSEASSSEDDDEPPKRSRKRSKPSPAPPPPTSDQPKRKRGRPRKYPLPTEQVSTASPAPQPRSTPTTAPHMSPTPSQTDSHRDSPRRQRAAALNKPPTYRIPSTSSEDISSGSSLPPPSFTRPKIQLPSIPQQQPYPAHPRPLLPNPLQPTRVHSYPYAIPSHRPEYNAPPAPHQRYNSSPYPQPTTIQSHTQPPYYPPPHHPRRDYFPEPYFPPGETYGPSIPHTYSPPRQHHPPPPPPPPHQQPYYSPSSAPQYPPQEPYYRHPNEYHTLPPPPQQRYEYGREEHIHPQFTQRQHPYPQKLEGFNSQHHAYQ